MAMRANDGKPWSALDVFDLRRAIKCGDTIEEAAALLSRADTAEVARKAEELGIWPPRDDRRAFNGAHIR
jgi:hypothetical protein